MLIEEFQALNRLDRIAITKHAKIRLEERGIRADDIIKAIQTGEIIKEYTDDRFLHLVISKDEEYIYLITAYFPDSEQWEDGFKTRREC